VAHVVECVACWDSFAKIDVQGANFSLATKDRSNDVNPPAGFYVFMSPYN